MSISKICNRDVVMADKESDVMFAAKLMREHHVGTVVIVNNIQEDKKPVGTWL